MFPSTKTPAKDEVLKVFGYGKVFGEVDFRIFCNVGGSFHPDAPSGCNWLGTHCGVFASLGGGEDSNLGVDSAAKPQISNVQSKKVLKNCNVLKPVVCASRRKVLFAKRVGRHSSTRRAETSKQHCTWQSSMVTERLCEISSSKMHLDFNVVFSMLFSCVLRRRCQAFTFGL